LNNALFVGRVTIILNLSFCRPSMFKKMRIIFLQKNKRYSIKKWSKILVDCIIKKKKKLKDNLTVLAKKGGVCLFVENLREVNIDFKIRGDVRAILMNP
jgi:hypothetical protein